MQNEMKGVGNFFKSSEFKKKSTYLAEDTAKVSFKWIGIGMKALLDFLKSMISMVFK